MKEKIQPVNKPKQESRAVANDNETANNSFSLGTGIAQLQKMFQSNSSSTKDASAVVQKKDDESKMVNGRKSGEGVNNHLALSEQGLQFIIKNEGMVKNQSGDKHVMYDDSENFATIGYGHLIAKKSVAALTDAEKKEWKNGLTEAEALSLLSKDAKKYEKALGASVTVELQQHEFDALVSWSFNVGKGWFGIGSHEQASAVKNINAGKFDEVGNALGMFQRADGKFNQGVLNRRNREINVFNYGYGESDDPFRDKGDFAAPQGKDKWKEDYWGKHLEKHKDISKLDDPKNKPSEWASKTAAEIWKECGKKSSVVALKLRPLLGKEDAVILKMLDYLSLSADNFSYYMLASIKASDLGNVNEELLKKMRAALAGGWTTEDEYKQIGKIDFVLGEKKKSAEQELLSKKEKEQMLTDTKALATAKKEANKDTILEGDVGLDAANNPKDVKYVKDRLLELKIITSKEHKSTDKTVLIAIINRYQRRIFKGSSDGLISANGTTANRLVQGVRGVASSDRDRILAVQDNERYETQEKRGEESVSPEKIVEIYKSENGDAAKVGKKMSDYLRTNPKMVRAMLKYSGWSARDNVAYHIVKNADDNSMARADKKLLTYLYHQLEAQYTSKEDYEQMARIQHYFLMPDEADFSNKELDVKKYWKTQGSTPHCDIYTKKIIDGHKKDNPDLYKEFGDIASSKTTKENSLHLVWEKEHEKGTSRTEGKKNANDISTLNKDEGEWDMAIRYIVAALNAGVPVMVGVNHTFAYSRAAGNNDKSTDHWLTIIGKGEDKNGKYFSYTDPGTSRKSTGTNTEKNRLYQSKTDKHIWRDETKYANSDAGKGSYTLVAVTLYDNHRGKSSFKVGSETFKRKNI